MMVLSCDHGTHSKGSCVWECVLDVSAHNKKVHSDVSVPSSECCC